MNTLGIMLRTSLPLLALIAVAAAPPVPPQQRVVWQELPLPPVAPAEAPGSCSQRIDPTGSGCMSANDFALRGADFLPDGKHAVAAVEFAGAGAGSPNHGWQVVLIKTDGSKFPSGLGWKCLTCGTSDMPSARADFSYPQAFPRGNRVLVGDRIFDCGTVPLASVECTPQRMKVYPIHWPAGKRPSEPESTIRELRIHPDGVHLGFNSFTMTNGALSQFGYTGRLQFDAANGRYELLDTNLLFKPGLQNRTLHPDAKDPHRLVIDKSAIEVGEFRGFTADGREAVYVGYPWEESNIDIFAVNLFNGHVRRLTDHPEYVDPVDFSPDGKWMVIEDTRFTDRQMFIAGMRGVPPLTDALTSSAVSSTRNNQRRRFFLPILLDSRGDRDGYFGQVMNAGPGTPNSPSDPNWNVMADPRWSPDSTAVLLWQRLVTAPECGGANPLPCPVTAGPEGRRTRLMIARLADRRPARSVKNTTLPDRLAWAMPVGPGFTPPTRENLPAGEYVLSGRKSGTARMSVAARPGTDQIASIAVTYDDFSDDGSTILNGTERVAEMRPTPMLSKLDWWSDLTQSGATRAQKVTSPGGFHLSIDILKNYFDATGTLTTMVDGKTYRQPKNGT